MGCFKNNIKKRGSYDPFLGVKKMKINYTKPCKVKQNHAKLSKTMQKSEGK